MHQKNLYYTTLIVLVDKYDLNNKPKFIEFDILKKEIENTISIMTGKINIDMIEEIFNYIDVINLEDESDNLENNNNNESLLSSEIREEEENNIYTDLKDINKLDLLIDTKLSFSYSLDDGDENDANSNSLENENDIENQDNDISNIINMDAIKKERYFLNYSLQKLMIINKFEKNYIT